MILWIKSNLIKILVIALITLFAITAYLFNRVDFLKADRNRIEENFNQVQQTNQVLNLTVDEYKLLNSKDKSKIDSLLEVIKVKPKQVKSATIINTVYKDTVIEKIVYLPSIKQPDSSFKIPFESGNFCWGVKGQILSKDQNSKIEITEKTANNSVQLVVTKKKKFLFWTIQKEKYQGFSDCGEVEFTQINFVKK